ncbi:hypothetical protein [Synechococcus sp. FACHB-909]|nr:hypothetical protein [Synechococcus sp. FACHB-909]
MPHLRTSLALFVAATGLVAGMAAGCGTGPDGDATGPARQALR